MSSETFYDMLLKEKLTRVDGEQGVKALCRLAGILGYKDHQYFGQFDGGCYGDLIEFLEDNPGCVEVIQDWVKDNATQEWEEIFDSYYDGDDV